MARWTPDPTFYPSPRLATQAPPEKLAYVATLDPTRKRPDVMAVVDLDSEFSRLWTDRWTDGSSCRRRASSLWLECL